MNRKREDENGQKQKKKKIGIIAAVLLGVYVLVMVLMLFLFGGIPGGQLLDLFTKRLDFRLFFIQPSCHFLPDSLHKPDLNLRIILFKVPDHLRKPVRRNTGICCNRHTAYKKSLYFCCELIDSIFFFKKFCRLSTARIIYHNFPCLSTTF